MLKGYKTQCVLLKIQQAENKLTKLAHVIEKHFHSGERILIAVQTQQAAEYLDRWLWQLHQGCSFYPHKIMSHQGDTPIAITLQQENYNHAAVLIHLQEQVHPLFAQFKMLYELSDISDVHKSMQLTERVQFYRAGGHPIWEE